MEVFTGAFSGTFQAVMQVFIIAFAAGVLVRRNVISQDQVKAVSAITVRVLLPCLIFSSILRHFHPGQLRIWPVIPIAAVAMIGFGLLAGAVLFMRQLPQKKNMLSLASMQNAGYLPLPVGSILFPDQFDKFKLYCFLYILGISPVLWSLGKYLVSSESGTKITLRGLLTPPFAANILALIFVFSHMRDFVPEVLLDSIDFVGSATVPVALFILGAMLGGISFRLRPYIFDAVRVLLVKMVMIPLCTIAVLYLLGLGASYPILASVFVVQASSAPATATMIQIKHYGGDEQKASSIILLAYLFCVISMPFWIAVWNTISSRP